MTVRSMEWHKGRLYSWNSFSVPSGYRLGDGVFETIRTYGGRAFKLDAHVSRLMAGAKAIGLQDLPDYDIVVDEILRTLEERRLEILSEEWILRPTFFSDSASWGFVTPIESWNPAPDMNKNESISVGISPYIHPGRYLIPPSFEQQVKWLSRGPLSHALRDAKEKGWEEALLLDSEQRVIEGTRSNVLLALEGVIVAPGALSGAFPGITREVVLECARRRGIEIVDRPISLLELQGSRELLLTSTLLGIAPVASIIVGKNLFNKPTGEISRLLLFDFDNEISKESH